MATLTRERLQGDVDGVAAAGWLRDEPGAVALSGSWLGGVTILSSTPWLTASPVDDPFGLLDSSPVDIEQTDGCAGVAVGGGWFGWLGFGVAGTVELIPPPPARALPLPRFALAFHDHVVLRDREGVWWFEALWTPARSAFLTAQAALWRRRLTTAPPPPSPFNAEPLKAVAPGLAGHHVAVAETVRRIAAGDFSQANICLRVEARYDGHPLDLWMRAAGECRGAYAAYFSPDRAGHAVVSLSPELFLRRQGREVESRPIKGTAPLSQDPSCLSASEKDRAENVMIVDLMRNDLGRVCSYGSVQVTELCAVKPAPGVWHLESTVRGRLRRGIGDEALLRATFPPGSVTGAPKVQALRWIHRLEATGRETYCGAIGLRSPECGLELSVAIRTFELADGRIWLGCGGGVVSDSSPEAEVREATAKAQGVASAAGLLVAADPPEVAPRSRPSLSTVARPNATDGVFETIRIESGKAIRLRDHLARLTVSCRYLGLPLPADLKPQIAAAATRVDHGGLRVTVTRAGVSLTERPVPAATATELVPLTVPGGLGANKWLDRAMVNAHSRPGVTPLICDLDGSVLEAGYAAIMLAVGGTIVAPPLDGRLLPSISRAHLLAMAGSQGWRAEIKPITVEDLTGADAIILTSSLRGPHQGQLRGQPPADGAEAVTEALRRTYALVCS